MFLYEETKYTPVLPADPHVLTTRKPSEVHDLRSYDTKDDPKAVHSITLAGSAETPIPLKRKSYVQRLSLSTTSPGGFVMLLRHIYQPFVVLFTLPAVAWTALIYGNILMWFSLILSTMSIYMTLPPYNFSSSGIGLMNLPPFIGAALGSVYGGPFSDWLIVRLAKRNHGIFEPEMRLWLALPAIVLTPGAIAMFGLCMAAVSDSHSNKYIPYRI